MYYKKLALFYGSFLLLMVSCKQKSDKVADDNKAIQIPVSMNDSSFLAIDRSPMDMSYFPADYPQKKMISADSNDLVARVIYSRPQKNGRTIFADSTLDKNFIQHYGKEWRLGANEATEIEFFKNVTINGEKFFKGRYIIYCIPYPNEWIIVFNHNLFSWGLHMDKTKDISEIKLPVTRNASDIEFFTMLFQNAAYGCDLVMTWGNVKVIMPVSFN